MLAEINKFIDQKQNSMLKTLESIVNIDSGSYNKQGIDQVANFFKEKYLELGFEVELDQQQENGNNLIARKKGTASGNILMLGHMDTVFKQGTASKRPFSSDGEKAYGPGVCDMKGGLVVLYYALKALDNFYKGPLPSMTIILNGDEEIGSPSSRPLIEKEAKSATHCFVLEPGRKDGSVVTSRKGVGIFELNIEGVASHAGSSHAEGSSAIEELAYKIIDLHNLTDYQKGITVNVGVIAGGERPNIVADNCQAKIDLRFKTMEDAEATITAMQEISEHTYLEGTKTELSGAVNRPPLVKNKNSETLYLTFKSTAAQLGYQLAESCTGGGSDGNFVSALAVPTIDALGAVGDHAHNEKEYIKIDSLNLRAKLLANSIIELAS